MFDCKLTRFYPVAREKIFTYWTTPKYLEQWAYPKNMSLKVPHFQAKAGGEYRFEHTTEGGVYICTGHIKEFISNSKLVQVDKVEDANGKILFEKLESVIEFEKLGDGTEVSITQRGFPDQASADECKESWDQSLDNLTSLLKVDLIRPGQDWDREGRAPKVAQE